MVTTKGSLTAATFVAVTVFGFASFVYGQAGEWVVFIDGSPVAVSRPAAHNGGELFVPLLPVARALGFQVESVPEFNSLRVRRGAGAVTEYDGRTGEVRFGPVVVGQIRNHNLVTLGLPLEELLFPVDGLISLLAIDVQIDAGANALYFTSSKDPFRAPSAHRVGVSTLDYSLGVTSTGNNEGHYALLRSNAFGGGIPLSSSFLMAGEGASVRLQQGTVTADLGRRRAVTLGDQGAISGIDSLVSSVRGVGFSALFKRFEGSAYAGRTAGSVRAQVGGPSVSNYDSTIVGGAMRKRSLEQELSFGASRFAGPERNGASAGVAFARTTKANQVKAQLVGGTFSGFAIRPGARDEIDAVIALDPSLASPKITPSVEVQGGALGLSFVDTFKPIEPLSITAHFERYGKNFLTAREDSEFDAQTRQRLSMTLRPIPNLNLYGGITRRRSLAGDSNPTQGVNYGASGLLPSVSWLQWSYLTVVQNDAASGRLRFSQYSATLVRLLEYSGNLIFTDFRSNGATARTVNAMLGRNLFAHGQINVNGQLQFNTLYRYGAEWQWTIPHGNFRVGLDRLTNLRTADRSYAPMVSLAFKLPGQQRLVATYSADHGMHTLSVVIGGPVVHREDFRRDMDGRVSISSQASLEGRVYFDADEDSVFNAGIDRPMPDITVWLDGHTKVVTDAKGLFRFDEVTSGTHGVRADIAEVPADMVFADSGERRVALLPFRDNVQNFAIVRTGALTGKVTYLDYSQDPDKPSLKPLAEARVIADGEHDTFSDLSGNITIGSLKPGTYQLTVDPETAPEGYVASVEPREIRVKAGETLRDVRIQLKLAPKEIIIKELPKQQSVSSN